MYEWIKNEEGNWEFYNTKECSIIGYVDILYTTTGKDKWIACFAPPIEHGKDADDIQEYVNNIQAGKDFVEEQYLTYKLIGPFKDEQI